MESRRLGTCSFRKLKKKLYILRYFEVNVILHTVSIIARIYKYDFRIRGTILGQIVFCNNSGPKKFAKTNRTLFLRFFPKNLIFGKNRKKIETLKFWNFEISDFHVFFPDFFPKIIFCGKKTLKIIFDFFGEIFSSRNKNIFSKKNIFLTQNYPADPKIILRKPYDEANGVQNSKIQNDLQVFEQGPRFRSFWNALWIWT